MGGSEPVGTSRFRVDIDGMNQYSFTEIIFPEGSVELVEFRDSTDPTIVRKVSGVTQYTNLILRWGITDSRDLYDWWRQAADGNIQRRNMDLILLRESGEEHARWLLTKAWPVRYAVAPLNVFVRSLESSTNEGAVPIATETIELAFGSFTRAA